MKYVVAAIIFALLQACGGGGSADPLPLCSVEINADSVMSDVASPETASAVMQRARPSWTFDDRAVTGLTMHSLVLGYAQAYPTAPVFDPAKPPFTQSSHQSQVVVIELGGNDAYESRNPAVFETELTTTITHLKASHKVPILTGIVQVETWGAFDADVGQRIAVLDSITRKVAEKYGIRHAGWHDLPPKTVDGIHPNSERLAVLLNMLVTTIDGAVVGVCR